MLDFQEPTADAIVFEDIAAGLAMAPRFGAQARRFYSVAQHAVSVSLIVERLGRPDLALAALHHDSHEAYACDIPRPLKLLLEPNYSKITDRLDDVIAKALGFSLPARESEDGQLIDAADDAAFVVEAESLLAGTIGGPQVAKETLAAAKAAIGSLKTWSPEQADRRFTVAHWTLLKALPVLVVPDHIQSDYSESEAVAVHLLPNEGACERVVFSSREDEDPGGYIIHLDRLRDDPHHWRRQLAAKRTPRGHRPAIEILAEELKRRGQAQA